MVTLEGDLRDISLPALVQLFCTKGDRVEIRISADEVGHLFVDDGEIVHARMGEESGEEAVYQLLGIVDGTFRISKDVATPERTVEKRTECLLIDGMRNVEDRMARAAEELRQDSDLDDGLVALLSTLEQLMVRLDSKKVQRKPLRVLDLCIEQLKRADELWRNLPQSKEQSRALGELVATHRPKIPKPRLLKALADPALFDPSEDSRPSGDAGDAGDAQPSIAQASQPEEVPRVCSAIIDLLAGYLTLMVRRFHQAENRETWSETCDLFLQELRRTLGQASA